jgi:hypothetical protein
MRAVRRFFTVLVVLAPLATSVGIAGCRQGVNDRCQVDSDCDDNLKCTLPPGATPQAGGTCTPISNDAGVSVDMTAAVDMTSTD